jgi:hypothetical protein
MMAHGLYHKNSTFYRRSSPDCHPERGTDRQRPVFQLGMMPRARSATPLLLAFRRTAALFGFFDLSQVFDGPLRYGASDRFDTITLNPHSADVPEHGRAVAMLNELDRAPLG